MKIPSIPELQTIPGGSFVMGSTQSQTKKLLQENPDIEHELLACDG